MSIGRGSKEASTSAEAPPITTKETTTKDLQEAQARVTGQQEVTKQQESTAREGRIPTCMVADALSQSDGDKSHEREPREGANPVSSYEHEEQVSCRCNHTVCPGKNGEKEMFVTQE